MKSRLIPALALVSALVRAAAAEPGWLEISTIPRVWQDSLPLHSPRRTWLVLDTPMATHLRGFLQPSPSVPVVSEKEIRAGVAGLLEKLPARKKVDVNIEWLGGDEKAVDFKRSIQQVDGMSRSSYRLGTTTIKRTVLVPQDQDLTFLHLIADQPGALSFRVSLTVSGEGEPVIEDRRQLIRPAAESQENSIGAHVWVIPFESDVTNDGHSISVQGEGEALILITCAAGSDATKSLAGTWKSLGERHDPGHFPPNPAKIWEGVLASHLKSRENSP